MTTGWESEENKALLLRIFSRSPPPSAFDRLRFAEIELWEAIGSLPPSAHTRGATDEGDPTGKPQSDPWHASACVLRAVGELNRARRDLEAADRKPGAQSPDEPGVLVVFNGTTLRLAPPSIWSYERLASFACLGTDLGPSPTGPRPTITWRTATASGTLEPGDRMTLTDGMVINVA
jgi:hypothetical protein